MKTENRKPIKGIVKIKKDLSGALKEIHALRQTINDLDLKKVDDARERYAVLSDRLQLLIKKITVVTEVGFSARHTKGITEKKLNTVLAAAIFSLDLSDDWWNEVDDVSVRAWVTRCVDAYRESKLIEITKDVIELGE